MENLEIKGSHDVFFIPSVNFNAETGYCEIAGESYLEETVKFYTPLIDWLKTYTETGKALTMDIKLTYFNTSSSRSILDILNLLKSYLDDGHDVNVTWFYNEEDEDMREEIEDYILETDLPINMTTF